MKLKDWECVEIKHHEDVGKTIKEREKSGWRLHTYSTAGSAGPLSYFVIHYLLFERETSSKVAAAATAAAAAT